VDRLGEPRCFPHPAARIERIETHISWVVLAGDFAYKLKKHLDLGFLDFSTLAKRRAACEDEVRLNRRLAPDLYLDVVAITGTADAPRIGGTGPPLEYAVRMRRFDREQELDRMLAAGTLTPEHIDELARLVARFHAAAPVGSAADPWGTPAIALANALANFEHVLALEQGPDIATRIAALKAWTRDTHARLAPLLEQRQRDGFVRECHGDLHLANMVLHAGRVVVFDCIEFNPALRWTDVMAEIAFTVMDLRHRGRPDLAQRFVNDYLEETGDYSGLGVLPFFLVYRAMVRAKVAAIRAAQPKDAAAAARDHASFRSHLALAEAFARPWRTAIVITSGLSGSGKSFLAAKLAATGDWIRLRSDVERKRLAGLQGRDDSHSAVGAGLYANGASERTYARLAELAADIVAAGFPVIVDATFLTRAQRRMFRDLAAALRVPFAILAPQVSASRMRERVVARKAAATDPSEATVAVLDRQLAIAEPLDDDEARTAVAFDCEGTVDAQALAAAVAARLFR
jgi:aminoglycoside phosphotransferase family enzyme/predicted kinase